MLHQRSWTLPCWVFSPWSLSTPWLHPCFSHHISPGLPGRERQLKHPDRTRAGCSAGSQHGCRQWKEAVSKLSRYFRRSGELNWNTRDFWRAEREDGEAQKGWKPFLKERTGLKKWKRWSVFQKRKIRFTGFRKRWFQKPLSVTNVQLSPERPRCVSSDWYNKLKKPFPH